MLTLPEHFSSDTSTTTCLVNVSNLCMEDVGAMRTTLRPLTSVIEHVKVHIHVHVQCMCMYMVVRVYVHVVDVTNSHR